MRWYTTMRAKVFWKGILVLVNVKSSLCYTVVWLEYSNFAAISQLVLGMEGWVEKYTMCGGTKSLIHNGSGHMCKQVCGWRSAKTVRPHTQEHSTLRFWKNSTQFCKQRWNHRCWNSRKARLEKYWKVTDSASSNDEGLRKRNYEPAMQHSLDTTCQWKKTPPKMDIFCKAEVCAWTN